MTAKLLAPLILIVFSVVGLAVPTGGGALQTALAQVIDADTLIQEITDEVDQEIEQEAEQEAEQEQEQEQSNEQSADQSNDADVSQDESNEQANVLETGDNTASTTQVGDNDAVGNEVQAESEGGDAGDDASANEDSEANSQGGDSVDASAALEQEVENEATTIQDSSADNNVLSNENEFGDDIAIVDQENIAEQNAANIGVQEQDLTQTIDQVQDAENFNFDLNVQLAQQVELPPPQEEEPPTQPPGTPPGEPGTPPGEPGTPPGGGGEEEQIVFCKTRTVLGNIIPPLTVCFETQSECESFEFEPVVDQIISECQRFEEPPPDAICFDPGRGRVSCEGFGGGGGENPQPP